MNGCFVPQSALHIGKRRMHRAGEIAARSRSGKIAWRHRCDRRCSVLKFKLFYGGKYRNIGWRRPPKQIRAPGHASVQAIAITSVALAKVKKEEIDIWHLGQSVTCPFEKNVGMGLRVRVSPSNNKAGF
jgi:hypothetical protein